MKHTLETLKNLEDYIRELDKTVGLLLSTKDAINNAIYLERAQLETKAINEAVNPVKDIDDFLEALNAEYLHKPNCFCSDCEQ